jgi:SAM-dependent methyltransferase
VPGRAGRDAWAGGEAYDRYMCRWSRLVAARFLAWLDLPPGGRWIDVGCGTGALAAEVLRSADPAAVVGVDPSPEQIARARSSVTDPRARFEVGDLGSPALDEVSADAVVSGLVLNFLPAPAAALARMAARCRPGGTVAGYVWDYAGDMGMLRAFWAAAVALDPAAAELDEARRFPDSDAAALAPAFRSAGLTAVETRPIDIAMEFDGFEDYWRPFLGGQGPAPGYVAGLDERSRRRLRDRLEGDLAATGAGGIRLSARAWAVRGQTPAPQDLSSSGPPSRG